METAKIREAILDKARAEADEILNEAKSKAREIIDKAKKRNEERREEERTKALAGARREGSKVMAQASLRARQTVLGAKDAVIRDIITSVKERLSKEETDGKTLSGLIHEVTDAFENDEKIVLYACSRYVKKIDALSKKDGTIKDRIGEIREGTFLGGVIGESLDGKVSIDNTFDMRLTMLMPKILPEIGRILFGAEKK